MYDLTVTDGGANYTTAPTVVLSGGNCSIAADAVATVDAATGTVTAVKVVPGCLSPGGNYHDRNSWMWMGLGTQPDFASQRTTMH